MSKLFTESGFLSTEGQRVFKEVLDGKIKMLLSQATDENELRLIGSLIQQRVGELITDAVTTKRQLISQYKNLSKEEMYAFLEKKYGPMWWLVPLTPEELEACPTITNKELQQALDEGAKAAKASEHISLPNLRLGRYR